jgi:hypothetical protein
MKELRAQATGSGHTLPNCPIEQLFDGGWDGLVRRLSVLGITQPGALLPVRVAPRFMPGTAPDVEAD